MDDDTYACMYLYYQMERMPDDLADIASNSTSEETLTYKRPLFQEDEWPYARLLEIPAPAPIHYFEENLEASSSLVVFYSIN